MGYKHALCCIFERDKSKDILRELSPLLSPESQERLCHLDWEAATSQLRPMAIGINALDARGVAGLQAESWEKENRFGIHLSLPFESEFHEILVRVGLPLSSDSGLIHFAMKLSIFAGEKYVLLRWEAPFTILSDIIANSLVINEAWRAYAERTGAVIGYLDLELQMERILFPDNRYRFFPDEDTLTFQDDPDFQFSVDAFTEYILYRGPSTMTFNHQV